jgi:hypothetical protein
MHAFPSKPPSKSRDGKTASDRNELALTAQSVLPPKKPPAASVKRRGRRSNKKRLAWDQIARSARFVGTHAKIAPRRTRLQFPGDQKRGYDRKEDKRNNHDRAPYQERSRM